VFEKIQGLMAPLQAFAQKKLVRAIQAAGMSSIAFTIVGSAFLIIAVLPQVFPFLTGIYASTLDHITNLYGIANAASMSILSIYFLIGIAFEFTRIYADEEDVDVRPLNGVLLAIFLYFMMMPQFDIVDGNFVLADDAVNNAAGVKDAITNGSLSGLTVAGWTISSSGIGRMGSSGIFQAIVIAWLAVTIYVACVKKNIVIKLPDVVPDGVARSFTSLVPATFIALTAMVLQGVFNFIGYDFYEILAIPFGFVVNLVNNPIGIVIIEFLIHLLWLVGIHGASIIGAFIDPIGLANFAANAEGTGHFVFAGQFQNAFAIIGGSGSTFCLTLFMLLLARSEQLKAIGKAEIAPAFFNINEPILFGLPIVYNPDMALPFFLAPMAAALVGYAGIATGLVSPIAFNAPWCTPIGVCAFLSTLDFKAIILAVVCAATAGAIYFPFFKAYDNKLYAEEQEIAAAEAAEA
jgi:PTS system cellobiose-specific IIC component